MSKNKLKVSWEYEKSPDDEKILQEIYDFLLEEPLKNED